MKSSPRFWRYGWTLLVAGVWLSGAWYILASVPPAPRQTEVPEHSSADHNFPNCRFGLGGPVESYSLTQLNLGWSMNWETSLRPTQPNGAEYVQVVHLKYYSGAVTFSPPTDTLFTIIDQNPGALWLIGNEPDSPYQDNLRPEDYAQGYHRVYELIKTRDPSVRAGAGSVVQPTPLRMQYLDRVLQAYRQAYQQSLPADVWSVHSYILREISYYDPEACITIDPETGQCWPGPLSVWGADIPPGLTATRGMLYELSDMFRVPIFQQRLIDFRYWLRDRGYQQTPLYITEYGTLFPYPPYSVSAGEVFTYEDELGQSMTEARTALFMTQTFSLLQSLSSSATGVSADNNRLVQRWLWYSVDDPKFGGLLFDPVSQTRRLLGDVFAAYVTAISPTVDWIAVRAWAEPVIQVGGFPVTATLHARIGNGGNSLSRAGLTVTFYNGPIGQPDTEVIATQAITPGRPGCGASFVASAAWPALDAGARQFVVRLQSSEVEHNLTNNIVTGTALVATDQVWLPLVSRSN